MGKKPFVSRDRTVKLEADILHSTTWVRISVEIRTKAKVRVTVGFRDDIDLFNFIWP